MRGLRRVGRQQGAFAADAARARGKSKRRRSRHPHRHQVRHRRSRHEDAARAFRKAEHGPRPFRDLTFNFNRHMIAAAEIGVQSGRQHLRQHADHRAAAVHPSHEAGMNIAGRIRRDELRIFAIDIAEIGRLPRDFCAKPRANLVRDRAPHRLISNIGDGVDRVIEHAMRLRAHLIPVRRIEHFAGPDRWRSFRRRHGYAAASLERPARRCNIAANASKTFRICGTL